jgi:hypothetical protein
MFDEISGFSAVLKMFDHDPQATLAERAWSGTREWTTRASMLALSQPDEVLSFPEGTVLDPQILLRNVTAKSYTAMLRLNWRSSSGTGMTDRMPLKVRPFETQVVDIAGLQSKNIVPKDANWASVFISAAIQPDELMAVATSYDKDMVHGEQTPFTDQLSAHWEGGRWKVDSTHDSLITAGNGGFKPVQAKLTLFYNGGSSKYEVERTLAPNEQMWLDIGKIIREQIADSKGRVLPSDTASSGAYQLKELNPGPLDSLFEGKLIIDKTYGQASYGCMICCGFGQGAFVFPLLKVKVTSNATQSVTAPDLCDDNSSTITNYFTTWSSGNTAIATANGPTFTGVAVSGTTHQAQGNVPNGSGQDRHVCPTGFQQPSGNLNVNPKILFDGTDITNTTQSVVVGQQIALSSSVPLPSGVTITSQSWSVPGTTVGGFNTGLTNGGPVPTNFSQGSTTFYWVTAGNPLAVTFTAHLSNGQTGAASATFNVEGPSQTLVDTAFGTTNILNNKLYLGGSGTNIGIKFTPSSIPPSGYANTFVFVQLLDNLTWTLTGSNGHTCTWSGLDSQYPYPYPPGITTYTDDNPNIGLSTAYTEESDNLSAHMYVMWSSGLTSSIPVPLGYVSWHWYGDAKYINGAWVVQSTSVVSANAFQASSSYPSWTTYFPNGSTCP